MPTNSEPLPKPPFGEGQATLNSDLNVFCECMSTVVTSLKRYEAKGKPEEDFRQKSNLLTINGLRQCSEQKEDYSSDDKAIRSENKPISKEPFDKITQKTKPEMGSGKSK